MSPIPYRANFVSTDELQRHFGEALSAMQGGEPDARDQLLARTIELLATTAGVAVLYELAPQFDASGIFRDSDWEHPQRLQPSLVRLSLRGDAASVAIEALSELRLLAIALGRTEHPEMDATAARQFLENVLALNLDLTFPESDESSRAQSAHLIDAVRHLVGFIADTLGTRGIVDRIIEEVEHVLQQRPVMVHRISKMIHHAARTLEDAPDSDYSHRAQRLIHALHGPSAFSLGCPEPGDYARALATLDTPELIAETQTLAESMRATGLVCPQHAVLLSYLARHHSDNELALGLGLDNVGRDSLDAYSALVRRLVDVAIHPATAQSVYGLACMLERGILFFPPLAPGLWRLIDLPVLPEVTEWLVETGGPDAPPATAMLLAGTLSVLGLPLGIGQGDNPTCQSARAISLWAQSDTGYLLELITDAARDGCIEMHFEGETINSRELQAGLAEELHTELDPVSLVLVPHLDRIYAEMGRRIANRDEDGHKWINPEFHGWWVHRSFATAIDYNSGNVVDFNGFIRLFYATYHPIHNGGHTLIYPQPAGIAATDVHANFIGWHAVAIIRVALDEDGAMRVYFYNPNNDSRQDWGQNIVTSTSGHGEQPGESSLPFHEFAARLYVFHYNPREQGDPAQTPEAEIHAVARLAREGWGRKMQWFDLVPG